MDINIDGLTASYSPSKEVINKVEVISKKRSIMVKFICTMFVLNFIVLQLQAWTDMNTVALGAIVIAINLIVVVIHLSLNELCKKAIKQDLIESERMEEARRLRVKYNKDDAIIMIMCFIQVVIQIIY
ncbi:hypothetical protein [Staphylococcus saprophyticus]|uniref:hypothetical protein n=1 Tax=Staphylococcus saprophyticus TaxID=29385 RepID=UPI00203B321F|nr:hypothetical protein [Staphylococcus saprophyticus]MCM3121354.1 hypothetical protein [Staphylococcus saprophyticus]